MLHRLLAPDPEQERTTNDQSIANLLEIRTVSNWAQSIIHVDSVGLGEVLKPGDCWRIVVEKSR